MSEPYVIRRELDLCIRDRRPVPPELRGSADYWVRRLKLEGHRGYARVISDRLTIADSWHRAASRDATVTRTAPRTRERHASQRPTHDDRETAPGCTAVADPSGSG